jgi:hypothetical protein
MRELMMQPICVHALRRMRLGVSGVLRGPAAERHLSVGALIEGPNPRARKGWAEYRNQHRLDIEGKVASRVPGSCAH